jgi:hypothetical protein
MDIDFSTSAGQGLSTRSETFSSEWLSITAHINREPSASAVRSTQKPGARETRTSMLMALKVKLSEEPRGADDDEWRAGGVRPEVRREPVEGGPREVVRNNEGIRVDKQRVLL